MHFPAQRFKQGPKAFGRILSAGAILMTASCGCCGDECPKKIDVIPDMVTAVPDKPFLMSVRVRDKLGNVLPDESVAEVQWKASDDHLTLSTAKGSQTVVTVSAATENPITLSASLGDLTGNATITRAKPGASLTMDWATARHVDGERPTLVLLDGQTYSEWRSDSLIAFVGAGAFDDLRPSDISGEVNVFSPGHALQRANVAWTDNCDHLRMTEDGAAYPTEVPVPSCNGLPPMNLTKPVSIPIHIWTLLPGDPTGTVEIQLRDARRKLANGWTGLTLDVETPGIEVLDERWIVLDISAALGWRCPTGTAEFSMENQLRTAGIAFGPGKVTVVYAAALMEPLSGVLVASSRAGYTCPRDAILGTVVLVSGTEGVGSTLAHELGHAIGPPLEHTNGMVDLNYSNLMWSSEVAVQGSRSITTLGQAFRLSLDADRFHTGPAAPTGPQCTGQNEAAENPCPRVAKDVVRK